MNLMISSRPMLMKHHLEQQPLGSSILRMSALQNCPRGQLVAHPTIQQIPSLPEIGMLYWKGHLMIGIVLLALQECLPRKEKRLSRQIMRHLLM